MATLILVRKKNSLVPGGADYGTLRISPRILEKIWNGPNGILWGWGETDSPRDTVPLTLVNFDFNVDNTDPAFPSPMRIRIQLLKLTRILQP